MVLPVSHPPGPGVSVVASCSEKRSRTGRDWGVSGGGFHRDVPVEMGEQSTSLSGTSPPPTVDETEVTTTSRPSGPRPPQTPLSSEALEVSLGVGRGSRRHLPGHTPDRTPAPRRTGPPRKRPVEESDRRLVDVTRPVPE